MHALVIDDNPDDRALVRRELEKTFDIVRVTDILDADSLEVSLARGDFDLAITDFQLRWSDGLKVLHAIRERYPFRPVIMYTGTGSEEIAVAAMQAGLDDYIIKSPDKIIRIRAAAMSAILKAAQRQALREHEERTRTLLETVADGIVVFDEYGYIHSFNPAAERIFGYRSEDVIGQHISLLFPESLSGSQREDIAGFVARSRGDIASGRDTHGLKKDGRVVPIEFAAGEMRLHSGATHYVGSIRDLSERVRMEEQARRSQKLEVVGQLTGGLAHDFNNLLTVILGNLDVASEMARSDSALRSAIDHALSAAERGEAITRRLLAFARQQTLQPQPLDLGEVIRGMSQLFSRTLSGNVEVKTAIAETVWPVLADKNEVESALLNLAVNARDAMQEGGILTIRVQNEHLRRAAEANGTFALPAGDYVAVSVSDTGAGMNEDILAQAFEPFFTTKEPGKGTGLGLSMVYGFAKQSKGDVKLSSQVGRGTTVTMYLPRTEREVRRPGPAGDGRAPNDSAQSILVVEDDDLVRRTVATHLAQFGFWVTTAANGPEALKILDDGAAVDVIFTDIVMPGGMSGRDLAREAVKRRPGIKVIFTSGYDVQAASEGPLSETADFLPKPFRRQDLIRKIRDALGSGPQPAPE